jgi:alkylated DNA repair dioxygenase AlkB
MFGYLHRMPGLQHTLFGEGAPAIDAAFRRLQHVDLGEGAWVDHCSGWLTGQAAVYDALRLGTRWNAQQREMYDRVVDVPRLTANLPEDGPGHPLLHTASAALSRRYRAPLTSVSMAWYRGGDDSVAWHGDRLAPGVSDPTIAIVSLGGPRSFRLRPKGGGRAISWTVGHGDLLVMGGSSQRTWDHAVPKEPGAPARIALMFRPVGVD